MTKKTTKDEQVEMTEPTASEPETTSSPFPVQWIGYNQRPNEIDFETSAGLGAIALALSKAQGAIEHAKRSTKNDFFNSRYAELGEIVEASREPLAKNELAVVQIHAPCRERWVRVVTLLVHSSGEWFRSITELPVVPQKTKAGDVYNAQAYGSTFTYARRYAWASIVGVATEDDDGNAGSGNAPRSNPRSDSAPPRPVDETTEWRPTEKQRRFAYALAAERATALLDEGAAKEDVQAKARQILNEATDAVGGIIDADHFDAMLTSVKHYGEEPSDG